MQSRDYVPGLSGCKIDSVGGGTAKAPERQMVSVEVASWSKYDLPKNASSLLQFMQAELERVPEQYRHAAEFEEFDTSYGDESFNARLFLSYSRLETEEELAGRLEKANLASRLVVSSDRLEISANGQVMIVMAAEPPFVLHADTCLINGRLIAGSQPDR